MEVRGPPGGRQCLMASLSAGGVTVGIAAYGPRNPVPPTLSLATRGSLLRGATVGNRGYKLLPKSPRTPTPAPTFTTARATAEWPTGCRSRFSTQRRQHRTFQLGPDATLKPTAMSCNVDLFGGITMDCIRYATHPTTARHL